MRNKVKCGLAMPALFSAAVLAGFSTHSLSNDGGHNPSQIINENSQRMAVISSEIKLLELEAELLERQGRVSSLTGVTSSSTESARPRNHGELKFIPSIVSIEGAGSNLTAVLNMGDGKILTVKTGDKITDNWKVDHINVRAITISGHGEKIIVNASGNPTPIRSE